MIRKIRYAYRQAIRRLKWKWHTLRTGHTSYRRKRDGAWQCTRCRAGF